MDKKTSVHDRAILLSNSVLGANDGIVTTFALIAGSTGASLPVRFIILLGVAKLFADAISMSSGVYLGLRSEIDYQKAKEQGRVHRHSLVKHASFTFFSFVFAGLLPLIPYLASMENPFYLSSVIVFIELFAIGVLRTADTKRKWFVGGVEMLFIGGLAALAAYLIGFMVDAYII